MSIAREPAVNYVPRVQGPLLNPASPIRTRIAYLVLRILCLRYKRIQKRSSPSSAGNLTVRFGQPEGVTNQGKRETTR